MRLTYTMPVGVGLSLVFISSSLMLKAGVGGINDSVKSLRDSRLAGKLNIVER